MKQYIAHFIIIILAFFLVNCKSKEVITDNKIDVSKIKIDNTIKETSTFSIDYSFDEIVLDIYEPLKETVITDNKGNTKTFKNVKTITTKKEKETVKKDTVSLRNDIKEVLKDKSIINTKEVIESDTKQFKGIFIAIAFIVGFALVGYLVFKFKR